ncbi:methyl-accepting chemotaxis protein [Thiomicrorhabdus sp. ZW0627]|uniref:methyl-accepting chemotaxis protein n=1 Tax=Thiomicrorhabdus sp. ZW0627 TaxID=3039774 RepID=UPI00243637AE|nr:methyl-accepting chemotaxis protein [Thiomicrorhabdus sp. ZW0627]MDG6773773.1 methyl-accepting chemotaxis protein [Thiomicrorhabdus sp. ZW0627]
MTAIEKLPSNSNGTGKERDVAEDVIIVSKTDLNGTITYVNDPFVEISGFSREELIGQPHNIVRHSDVPKAVFADLWATLKQGKTWVQLVKNRCKNGDYYWVEANVSPIVEKGKVVGYMSVRRKISDAQKKAAQALYQQIGQGKKQIKNGYVQEWAKRFNLVRRVNPLFILMFMIVQMSVFGILEALAVISIHWVVQSVVLTVVLLLALYVNRYVKSQVGTFDRLLAAASEGDFTTHVDTYGNTWLAKLADDLKKMQIQMGASYEHNRVQLLQNTRLKTALDNASTSVMVADNSGHIIYLNNALVDLFGKHQAAIRQEVGDFDVNHLIDQPLDVFYQDPQRQSKIPTDLTSIWEADIQLGDLLFHLVAQPVLDTKGMRIGSVVEWQDMTQQRSIEARLDTVLRLAAKGHTDLMLDNKGLDGFYLYTANNINDLLKSLNGAVEDVVKVMTGLAQGDIQNRVEKELSGSLAAMKGAANVSLDNLSAIIQHIRQVAASVSLTAEESAKASNDLSERSQQAASTLGEVNEAMQNIDALQTQNTESLTGIANLAQAAIDLNREARESMDASMDAMEGIKQTSEKIGDIIGLIDGIAFQTNLLALNAAVEAARAGEHGRGFAVVAGEVRNLAQKSAEAARDIKGLIEESTSNVNQGSEKVQATHKVFGEVDTGVSKISETMEEVMRSIQQQQESVHEISGAIGHLDQNIQQNASLVEETSSSARNLSDQARLLDEEVSKFKLDESAANRHKASPVINGIKLSEVRQNMNVWRITAQSYINGIGVELDESAAVDATACAVGHALSAIAQAHPQVRNSSLWERIDVDHQRQHDLLKQALVIREQMDGMTDIPQREKLGSLLDEFVVVTERLDQSLFELENQVVTLV